MACGACAYRWAWAWFAGFALAVASPGAEPAPADEPEQPTGVDSSPRTGLPPPSPESAAPAPEQAAAAAEPLYLAPFDPPLGITGPSRIPLDDIQQDNNFVPIADRWRIRFPSWDRYGKGHPRLDDYPYAQGAATRPFTQNVFKGDYPSRSMLAGWCGVRETIALPLGSASCCGPTGCC